VPPINIPKVVKLTNTKTTTKLLLDHYQDVENAGIYLFAFVGVVIAAIIEFDALYLRHKWHYNALMPTVLGLGISPLLQLSITGILNVLIVKRLLKL